MDRLGPRRIRMNLKNGCDGCEISQPGLTSGCVRPKRGRAGVTLIILVLAAADIPHPRGDLFGRRMPVGDGEMTSCFAR